MKYLPFVIAYIIIVRATTPTRAKNYSAPAKRLKKERKKGEKERNEKQI